MKRSYFLIAGAGLSLVFLSGCTFSSNISKQDGPYAAYVQECVELLMEHGTDIRLRLRVDKGPGFPDNGKMLCGMDQENTAGDIRPSHTTRRWMV